MSRKDYNIEQRRREEDRQLHKKGPVEEEVRVMEYRDLWINPKKRREHKVVDKESSRKDEAAKGDKMSTWSGDSYEEKDNYNKVNESLEKKKVEEETSDNKDMTDFKE